MKILICICLSHKHTDCRICGRFRQQWSNLKSLFYDSFRYDDRFVSHGSSNNNRKHEPRVRAACPVTTNCQHQRKIICDDEVRLALFRLLNFLCTHKVRFVLQTVVLQIFCSPPNRNCHVYFCSAASSR